MNKRKQNQYYALTSNDFWILKFVMINSIGVVGAVDVDGLFCLFAFFVQRKHQLHMNEMFSLRLFMRIHKVNLAPTKKKYKSKNWWKQKIK